MQFKLAGKGKNALYFTKLATKDLTQSEFSRRVLSIVCVEKQKYL